MKRPRARFLDLSKCIMGAAEKPSQTGRAIPQVRVGYSKPRYQGLCARCGGARVIVSLVSNVSIVSPCPQCTGYQK